VNAGYAEAGGGELGGLVVHEGDEGGDDEGSAAAGYGGELVAEGLSAPVGMTRRTSRPSVAARQTAS